MNTETTTCPSNEMTYYWSRAPGKIVNKFTGKEYNPGANPPFYGNIREWYELFSEVISDAAHAIFKTHHQQPRILEVSPEALTVLEHLTGYRTEYYENIEDPKSARPGAIGEYVGVLNSKFYVHVNPEFTAGTAKLVLATDKKVTAKSSRTKKIPSLLNGNEIPSTFVDDWTTETEYEVTPLAELTRVDGRTIKILDCF